MKILKNSTYEGMCQEIEDGNKKIQSLTEQVSTERNKHAAALKEKQDAQNDFDQQLKSKSEEIERFRRENAELRRKNREAEGELNNKKEELKTLRSEKAFFEKEMNQAKEDLAKLVAENAQLKKQTSERKPQRTSNGRFAKKKDNE